MAQKKKVRLSDIADKLNISTVTVSKALADKEGVGDELREKIKQVASKMGYRIKSTSQFQGSTFQTAGQNTGTGNIGILIPSRFFSPNVSYYWHIFNALSGELMSRNFYSIMEIISDDDENNLILPKIVKDKKVDGLIILGQVNIRYIESINNSFSNLILLDFYTKELQTDSVSNDDYYCSYLMTDYVISQGHKKLRFVGNFGSTTSISDRYMGFEKAMLEHGLSTKTSEIINDRNSNGASLKEKIQLPSAKEMPTAFICNCDETAALVISELTKKGYRIPEDISVTGFDNYLPLNNCPVELTTVFIKPEDTAKTAAELIICKIKGLDYIKGRHLVSGSLVIRDSVKSL